MKQLKLIEQCLASAVQSQLEDLKKIDTKELGEVIDMIKDLEEAMYYCSISEAMEKSAEEKEWNSMNVNYDKSGMYRRMYMEGKQSMEEPGHYIKDLGGEHTDIAKESG